MQVSRNGLRPVTVTWPPPSDETGRKGTETMQTQLERAGARMRAVDLAYTEALESNAPRSVTAMAHARMLAVTSCYFRLLDRESGQYPHPESVEALRSGAAAWAKLARTPGIDASYVTYDVAKRNLIRYGKDA